MTYINKNCADAGTPNCPCPLAETGDCLICSRLAGRDTCDCAWAGVCVYNEFIQNDKVIRGDRKDLKASIVNKRWYGSDMLVLTLDAGRQLALEALRPGSFAFLSRPGAPSYTNVPVSVMKADHAKGRLTFAFKICGSKTKMLADSDEFLMIRGIYRNGLLGSGLQGMYDDMQSAERRRWLICTKGVGFAPAVNLLRWADGKTDVDMMIDTDKINEEIVNDHLGEQLNRENMKVRFRPLDSLWDSTERSSTGGYDAGACDPERLDITDYDRVIILASDYYIKTLAQCLGILDDKLVFSNNFHMCCGEGICGACGHVDSQGRFSKMCKCRTVDMQY